MSTLIKLIKVFGVIFTLIGLLIASILAVISFIDVNQYKDTITAQVKELTGRELTLLGDLQLKVALSPSVIVEDARFANAPWGSREEMVTVGRLEVEVGLIPLISGDIRLERFILVDPSIYLETNKQGQRNWELDIAEPAPEEGLPQEREGLALQVIDVRIEDGQISYLDGATKETTTFQFERLSLQRQGANELRIALKADYNGVPVDLRGNTGRISNLLQNEQFPLQLEGTLGEIDIVLEGQLDHPMDAKGMNLTLSGESKDLTTLSKLAGADLPVIGPLKLNTRLTDSEDGFDLSALEAKLGKSELNGDVSLNLAGKRPDVSARLDSNLIDLSVFAANDKKSPKKQAEKKSEKTVLIDPKALQPMRLLDADVTLNIKKIRTAEIELDSLQTTVSLKNGKLALKGLNVQFAGSDLGGNASFDPFAKRPVITARLNSNTLDLTALQKSESGKKAKQAGQQAKEKQSKTPGKLFSPDALSLQSLRELDADVSLKAGQVKTKDLAFNKLDVSLKIHEGKLAIKPLKLAVAGGDVQGDILLNALREATTVTANMNATQVELGRISSIEKLIQGGKSNTSIKLAGKGKSVKDIMAGLNGSLVFEVGKGSVNAKYVDLLGSDLLVQIVQKVNPLAKKGETSRLECAAVRFDVKDGVSTIDRGIALQTDKMNVVGSGAFNLKEELVDLSLRPDAREGLGVGAGELAQLVRVAGPFSNPGLAADAKGVAKLGATIGVAVATAGTSYLAQKLISRTTRDETPCLTALGKAPQGPDSGKTAKQADAPSKPETDSGVTGGVNKLLKDTKSLFGN